MCEKAKSEGTNITIIHCVICEPHRAGDHWSACALLLTLGLNEHATHGRVPTSRSAHCVNIANSLVLSTIRLKTGRS